MTTAARLAAALAPVTTVLSDDSGDDGGDAGGNAGGALTVAHDGAVASLRVVSLAEDLELVSLTSPLVWDAPLDDRLRQRVAEQAAATMLGSVVLVEKPDGGPTDVMLRYAFPAAGLTDDALVTLILLVLARGAEVRRAFAD